MANPLSAIIPVLDVLGKNIDILPATGIAVEDLQYPDKDVKIYSRRPKFCR